MMSNALRNELKNKQNNQKFTKTFSHASKKLKDNIVVAIPTYNRPNWLKRLVEQINKASKNYNVTVIILDDGSNKSIDLSSVELNNINKLDLYKSRHNNGKKGYWITVNFLLNEMAKIPGDYYFYLGDDLELPQNFFEKAIDCWNSIKDTKKITLNLLNDGREECWTNFKRRPVKYGKHNLFLSQWVDMIMMFDEKLLDYRIDPVDRIRWVKNPNLSSGVGNQLSRKFYKNGYNMYQVVNSLVYHSSYGTSVMNPTVRKNNHLTSIL